MKERLLFEEQSDGGSPQESLGWRAQLKGENKTDPYFEKFSDFDSLALHAKAVDGKLEAMGERVYVPGEGATEEEVAAFQKAIGVPEDYDLAGKKIGQMEIKGDWEAKIKEGLKNGKFTKAQADTVLEILNSTIDSVSSVGVETLKTEAKKAEQQFRKEWGDDYDTKRAGIRKIMLQFGGADYLAEMDRTGLGNNPQHIKMLANILDFVGNHKILEGEHVGGAGTKNVVGIRYPSMEGMNAGR